MLHELDTLQRAAAALAGADHHLLRLADQATDELLQANRGQWPTTMEALRHIAHGYGLTVSVDPDVPLTAFIADTILVPDRYDDVETYRRILHEIVERAGVAGQLYVTPNPDQRIPHQVAQLVEAHYAIVLTCLRSAEEFAARARQRRRKGVRYVR